MITGWLVRLVVVLGVLGVLGHDAISVGVTAIGADDAAAASARAGQNAYATTQDLRQVYSAALTALQSDRPDATLDPSQVVVGPDGSVTVTVTLTARTLVLERVGPLADRVEQSGTAVARPVS